MTKTKAFAIITKGKIKEWYDAGSGLRILRTQKQAESYLKENSKYAIYPPKGSKVVPCTITFNFKKK